MMHSSVRERVEAGLQELLAWLLRRREILSVERWAELRATIESWLTTTTPLLERGAWTEAERALTVLATRYGIQDLLSSAQGATRSFDPNDPTRGEYRSPAIPKGLESFDPGPTRSTAVDAVQRLRALFSPSAPPAIDTYPEARIPAEVAQHTLFAIEVTTRGGPTPQSGTKVSLPRRKRGPVDLEVALVLPEGLRSEGAAEGVLRVPENGNAAELVFRVRAVVAGAHQVAVVFRQDGIERSRLERPLLVRPPEEAASPLAAAPPHPALATGVSFGNPYSGLLLRVDLDLATAGADQRALRVWLGGTLLEGMPVQDVILVPADARRVVADLCRDLYGLRDLTGLTEREARLRNVGAALAKRLLPQSVLAVLADPRFSEGTKLHIESDDAWAPWEALWVGEGFLGERFAVTRWLRQGRPLEQVGGAHGVLVTPPDPRLQVDDERRALRLLLGAPVPEHSRIGAVLELLGGTWKGGVMHLACHGGTEPNATFREVLKMEGGLLRVVDVRGPLEGALVFLNACQAGLGEPSLWDHSGWAGAFLGAGAGTVVAPSWVVSDVLAAAYAVAFYEEAATGQTLGEAARRARRAIGRAGQAERLGFAVYAAPTAVLTGRSR